MVNVYMVWLHTGAAALHDVNVNVVLLLLCVY